MAVKTPKVKVPTEEEKQALKNLLYDSCLFQAHPIVVTNVREGISKLLTTLGRGDLVPLWEDAETLLQLP